VIGGYPPPGVAVFVGSSDVSDMFYVSSLYAVLQGSRGLRRMTYKTNVSTDNLSLTADDDGRIIRCAASVSGLAPADINVTVRVHCKLINKHLYL